MALGAGESPPAYGRGYPNGRRYGTAGLGLVRVRG